MAATYNTLEPSSGLGSQVTIDSNLAGVTGSLTLVLLTVGVLGAIFFRFAPALVGFMSGDNAAKRSQAKDNFWAGVFGVGFILLLIPFATSINSSIGKLSFNSTGSNTATPSTPGNPAAQGTNPIVPISGVLSESALRNTLMAVNIKINKDPCTASQMRELKPSCTNIQGLPQEMVNLLLDLRNACKDCEILITGGTEPGHQTHGVGRMAFDLRLAPGDALYKFITAPENIMSGPSGVFSATYLVLSAKFNDETIGDRHWHVNR